MKLEELNVSLQLVSRVYRVFLNKLSSYFLQYACFRWDSPCFMRYRMESSDQSLELVDVFCVTVILLPILMASNHIFVCLTHLGYVIWTVDVLDNSIDRAVLLVEWVLTVCEELAFMNQVQELEPCFSRFELLKASWCSKNVFCQYSPCLFFLALVTLCIVLFHQSSGESNVLFEISFVLSNVECGLLLLLNKLLTVFLFFHFVFCKLNFRWAILASVCSYGNILWWILIVSVEGIELFGAQSVGICSR